MMKKVVLLLLICLSNGWLLANHWTPNDSGYEDNMTLTGIIQIDGVEQHSSTLEVGVFCGEECRGTGYPTYFSPMQRYVIQLLVFGEVGDQLTFKLFDNDLGQELNLASLDTVTFIANGYGSLANPYILGFIGTSHHWIPNQTSYEDNMTLTGVIQINGVEQQSTTLEVGVFCGGECRGTGYPTYFPPTQRYVIQLLIFGETGDPLTFKLYDSDLGQEIHLNSPEAVTFSSNGYGSLSDPYILTFTEIVGESYSVSANANPIIGGTVEGTGVYQVGQICTLLATANEGYIFSNWTENGISVSTNPTYAFSVTSNRTLVANFTITGNNTHWIPNESSYEDNMTLTGVIQINGVEQQSTTLEVGVFCGDDCRGTGLANYFFPTQRYVIQLLIFGESGDQLTFRLYDHNLGQELNLNVPEAVTFTSNGYGSLSDPYILNFTEDGFPLWVPNDSDYEDNMTLTGIIQINGIEQQSTTLEVGVFCGDECRSTGMATYFFPTQRYMVQLLIFGETGDQLTFKLYDHALGQELNLISPDAITFTIDGYGNPINPYMLNFTSSVNITATTTPEGAGMVTGTGEYTKGTICTLTATAATGYTFQNWTLDDIVVSTDVGYSFEVNGTAAYVAHFILNSYDITATADPAGTGMVSGAGTYNHFTTCTLTATAATGYTFQNWTLDDMVVSTDAEYSFEVNGAAAYVAHFALNSYDIIATADPIGTGMVSGAGTYNHFTTCTLTATAATGYTFQNWTLDDMVVSTDAEYSFEVNGAAAYVAHFALNSYDITATTDPTEAGMVTGTGRYNHGAICMLTATPASGYTFVKWTKDGSQVSTSPSYTFTVTGGGSYVAHFGQTSYQITATANPTSGGTVTGEGTYSHGASCTLNATPSSGYTFEKWTKDGSQVSTSSNYTFTVTENAIYVAHFSQNSYQITATANPTSGGTVTGEGTYSHGASCTLNATPSSGYTFEKWTKDGSQVSTSSNYTFTVTENAIYVAHFSQNSYQITATVNPTAGGTVTGAGTYSHGALCTLNATSSSGYTFEKWTKDGSQVSTNSSYTFTVTENASFVANFERWEEHSPVIVEIGTDVGTNTNSYLPAYTLYSNTLSEQIYTPEEVTMAGTISSVAFYNEGTEKTPNIKLYLINTNKSEFSSNTNWFQVTQSDLAFEGDVTFVANDWTIITLDNEFLYDGTSNLGLIVDEYMLWSGGLSCRVFNSTNNCSMYVYSDNTDYNAIGASYTANNRLSVKNQIKLGITPIGASFCPKPTGLTATYITGHGATLNWNGVGESYNVMYRTAAYMDGITEDFSTTSIPAGWASYSGQLNNGIADLSSSSTWTFGSNNGVFDNHARVNIYSSGCYKWLIMPAITIPDCSELNFDLALTAYSGTVTAPAITGTDDKFIVLVSTDNMTNWTTLREWNNSGSTYVFNNIAHTATGENVTIDLSAYAGQSVHIAFYVESTVSNADNNLHIDNVTIGSFYEAGEWQTVTTNEVPFQLTGLDPLTPYEVKVQSDCGSEDLSLTTDSIRFTTFESCPTPTNLATSNINGHNATLNWNGVGESYNVMYRTAAYMDGIAEEFSATSIPDGWVSYSGQLNDGTATLSSSSNWFFDSNNGVFDNHARVNIYSSGCYKWLIMPAITIPACSDLNFDLALTAYSGTVTAPAITGTDDKFIVLVSTDNMTNWTTLREWNNSGSTYVFNNIAHTATGENVTIDLSAHAGQSVHIAFYVESTVSNADNNLHIDNVTIGSFYEAGEWQTLTTDEVPFQLTGLDPLTPYEVKVQSDCGSEGMSLATDTIRFTTIESCPTPTDLAISNINGHGATLNWNGMGESYNVMYRTAAYMDGIAEDFSTTSIPDGWVSYTGQLNDGTAILSSSSSWSFGESNGVFNNHARVNIYNTNCYKWLVTPAFTVPAESEFSFDLALTAFSGTVTDPTITDTDDKFIVLVSTDTMTTWTTLREWNNTGSTYVLNNIAHTATGENVTIDLSAYTDQSVRIAFYVESTVSNADNNLHIDNVTIGDFYEAGEWQTLATDEVPFQFTGLTPLTLYEAKVQSDCGSEDGLSGWSNILSFMPTNVVVVGSGTATNQYFPTYCSYKNSLTQQIYTPTELGEAGLIERIDFNISQSTTKERAFDIYMVGTEKSSFESGTDWITVTEDDKVYSGSLLLKEGWNAFALDKPFIYDGAQNVAIVVDASASEWESGPAFLVFDAPSQAIRVYSDGTDYNPLAPTNYSGTVLNVKNQIRILVSHALHFVTAGSWSEASNWQGGRLPSPKDEVCIDALCQLDQNATVDVLTVSDGQSLTLQSGKTLIVTNALANTVTTGLVIEDGAQLVHASENVAATVKKSIAGYGTGEGKWCLIACPLVESVAPSIGNGLLSGNYDLYSCSPLVSDGLEWRNYKQDNFMLLGSDGYLYANKAGTELSFGGILVPSNSNYTRSVNYYEGNSRLGNGWALLGNPFVCDCYLVDANGNPLTIYKMNADGTGLDAVESGPIAPFEGFFYYTPTTCNVYFSRTAPSKGGVKD